MIAYITAYGLTFSVDFEVEFGNPSTFDDPGDPDEVTIDSVHLDGVDITACLSDLYMEMIEEKCPAIMLAALKRDAENDRGSERSETRLEALNERKANA